MKYLSNLLGTLLVVSSGMLSLPQLGVNAVTLSNGAIAFVEPPRLVSLSTPYNTTSYPRPTYYLTLAVPAKAGEPLQQVTVVQRSGSETIKFEENQTFAFIGTRHSRGQNLVVKGVNSNPQKQTITVSFDTPVAPGQTVTIGLSAERNPLDEGVFLFDIAAFPAGNQTSGQSLGVARLTFYGSEAKLW